MEFWIFRNSGFSKFQIQKFWILCITNSESEEYEFQIQILVLKHIPVKVNMPNPLPCCLYDFRLLFFGISF